MERMYLNGRLKNLGSGQQHKVNPGCGGEETVRDEGLNIIANGIEQQMPKTRLLETDDEECHHNNSVINEVQVS